MLVLSAPISILHPLPHTHQTGEVLGIICGVDSQIISSTTHNHGVNRQGQLLAPVKKWHYSKKLVQKANLKKEYTITSGNLSQWISSANENNAKICKRQCEVMKEVETDKELMKKYIDKCEILITDLTSPILKTVFQCRCNYRFIRECHIFRHLRYKNHDDKNISQKKC